MTKIRVAMVDVLGLTYDGNTLKTRGLGGSESAIIYMAKEMVDLGMDVTVFNSCIDSQAKEGFFEGVRYVDLGNFSTQPFHPFDVFIGSRSIRPFVEAQFMKLSKGAFKILWMHDTFCEGDEHVESLLLDGRIDEIFTLSDFHTTYIHTCHHGGNKRNSEVLKRKTFMTRNGIKRHRHDVDPTAKNPNLFVYNASVTKGMVPLVTNIWAKVKARIPQARLKVIGGYYRFRDNAKPDAQEEVWRGYVNDPSMKAQGIEFLGIIPQREIADILEQASFMIYPGAFPETFGISALESLAYNTPLITTRFGALEETAVEKACYLMDYAIEPNSLYPNINHGAQVEKFVEMTVQAHANTYLHAQKKQYCNIVHEVCGWDTVALQWKQHFFRKLGRYFSVEEYRRVQHINARVHQIFGRRFSNPEEWPSVKTVPEQHIHVIIPFYNAANYIENCIRSVITQDYDNYTVALIDDCSDDNGFILAENLCADHPKVRMYQNSVNRGAVYNQIDEIRRCDPNTIVMLLDGDDVLVQRNDLFQMYNSLYTGKVDYTYGSSWSMADDIPLVAQPYPPEVIKNKTFRDHRFAWNMPYTHLRTFRAGVLKGVEDSAFQDEAGNWLKAGGDTSIFYEGIERAKKIKVVQDIVYLYNDKNPLNDYKVNGKEQTKNANYVLRGDPAKIPAIPAKILAKIDPIIPPPMTPIPEPARLKQILIGIPTAKYIESDTFKSIYDLEVPEGYKTFFQCFYGYNIDQVRNLIADWATHYDYLFSVDSDIVLPKDTLVKMLKADKDMISGVYCQRKPLTNIIEIYDDLPNGGCTNIDPVKLSPPGLYKVAGCGFGCVLIKGEVFRKIPYPHFEYHSALTIEATTSEDVDFCIKAKAKGFTIWCDSTIICDHIGNTVFRAQIPNTTPYIPHVVNGTKFAPPPFVPLQMINLSEVGEEITPEIEMAQEARWKELADQRLLPVPAQEYLNWMRQYDNITPSVIYDIGACVMHWTTVAKEVWPDAHYVLFEAMDGPQFLYEDAGITDYYMGVLSDTDGKVVEFYENPTHPGGNSYYRENTPEVDQYFPESSKVWKMTTTLDTITKNKKFPLPDLIKMDVQGAELDILMGAENCLNHATDLILELQSVVYNVGAPLKNVVIQWLERRGWSLVAANFSKGTVDGDYHFKKRRS